MNKGTLFVVSAPSGAGKTSLVKALRESLSGLAFSVSHTTRPQRPGEVHGQDYFFIDRAEFERMVTAGEFLEHAKVFDNRYGTARRSIEATLGQGQDIVLEIDWQGARQIREILPDCVSIFILPPSRTTLEDRLTARGQDDAATIARRMRDAISEMAHYDEYDYLVVNDDFQQALAELRSIVVASRLKTQRQTVRYRDMLAGLLA
jgi:guanylate kinase